MRSSSSATERSSERARVRARAALQGAGEALHVARLRRLLVGRLQLDHRLQRLGGDRPVRLVRVELDERLQGLLSGVEGVEGVAEALPADRLLLRGCGRGRAAHHLGAAAAERGGEIHGAHAALLLFFSYSMWNPVSHSRRQRKASVSKQSRGEPVTTGCPTRTTGGYCRARCSRQASRSRCSRSCCSRSRRSASCRRCCSSASVTPMTGIQCAQRAYVSSSSFWTRSDSDTTALPGVGVRPLCRGLALRPLLVGAVLAVHLERDPERHHAVVVAAV